MFQIQEIEKQFNSIATKIGVAFKEKWMMEQEQEVHTAYITPLFRQKQQFFWKNKKKQKGDNQLSASFPQACSALNPSLGYNDPSGNLVQIPPATGCDSPSAGK